MPNHDPNAANPSAAKRPRILILTHYFHPETAAVAQFTTEIAQDFAARGSDVAVVTSRAPYQRDALPLPADDRLGAIRIRRAFGTRFDKRRLWGRALNLATFLSGATLETTLGFCGYDVLMVCNAPLLGIVGWLGWLIRRRPYVCVVEDIYPDLAVKFGILGERSVIRRLWDAVNALVYSRAVTVITLGGRMRATLETNHARHRRAPLNLRVIPSWADGDTIRPLPKPENPFAREHGTHDRLTVLYSGNMGLAHDLETLIQAAEALRDDPRFFFLFIGDGGKRPRLAAMVGEKRLENVKFLPYQPLEQLPWSLTCGDVSVVTMEAVAEGLIIPSKIYGSLAAGQAILGLVGEQTEVADIIHAHACGVQVTPGDTTALVAVLRRLADEPDWLSAMQRRARQCFEEHFRRESALAAYWDVVSAAAARRS
ncbi:MAG: glycosyltransferase family 4 protein [Chloracidobacterium sp.]|uniref:Glycosyltransferase family 4 protein n=1 Tax=Chloracidobacterium validum TaxID=2821543 RepID=A0ABX8BGM6_9BACT|nr:glycosyltransferase family 4 protein [Chloracidobacterium validum]QUW04640.1 glycosyltransferase family 4 protein [Chloracidobacterium validum]